MLLLSHDAAQIVTIHISLYTVICSPKFSDVSNPPSLLFNMTDLLLCLYEKQYCTLS